MNLETPFQQSGLSSFLFIYIHIWVSAAVLANGDEVDVDVLSCWGEKGWITIHIPYSPRRLFVVSRYPHVCEAFLVHKNA